MNLYPIYVARLQQVEFGQFMVRLITDINSLKLDLSKDPELSDQLDALSDKSDIYSKALQQIKAQQETAILIELDNQRDYKITAIRRMISVNEHSDDEKEQTAYIDAKIIMNKYEGIEIENYEAESKSIQLMLSEWNKPEHKDTIAVLSLQKLLDRLKKAADAFDNKFNTRSANVGVKEVFNTKGIRKELEAMYKDIADDILAMAKRKKTDFYNKLLDMVNNSRRYYSDILAKRTGNNKEGKLPPVPPAS